MFPLTVLHCYFSPLIKTFRAAFLLRVAVCEKLESTGFSKTESSTHKTKLTDAQVSVMKPIFN